MANQRNSGGKRRKPSAAKPAPAAPEAPAAPRMEPAVSRGRGAITYDEFVAKARDVTLDEKELRPFMTIDRANSRPFRPAMHLDPSLVKRADGGEIRAEGALDWANGLSRWRRQEYFRTRKLLPDVPTILVSEGDSWFQFPILIADVIDQLGDKYLIWSVDAAGDTLQNMVAKKFPEYLGALRDTAVTRAFLFSGGGNDLVGEDASGRSVIEQVLKPFEAGQPVAWYLDTAEYAKVLASIEESYRTVLGTVAQEFPGLPVIIHGYDYSIPGPAPNEWRTPIWASIDQWLGRPLRARGIVDHQLQRDIIRRMIDDLNELQIRLCGGGVADSGKYKDVYHVDVRGTLADADWADELHPTDAGFAKVAALFRAALSRVVS